MYIGESEFVNVLAISPSCVSTCLYIDHTWQPRNRGFVKDNGRFRDQICNHLQLSFLTLSSDHLATR